MRPHIRPGSRTRLARGLLAASCLFACACAGGRSTIVFDHAAIPVSMSTLVRDGDGRMLKPKDLDVVGSLLVETKAWGIMYSWIPLPARTDVSREVNEQVRRAGGEAVTQLSVTNEACGINYVFPLTILPVWPGCSSVTVRGAIVRRKQGGAS